MGQWRVSWVKKNNKKNFFTGFFFLCFVDKEFIKRLRVLSVIPAHLNRVFVVVLVNFLMKIHNPDMQEIGKTIYGIKNSHNKIKKNKYKKILIYNNNKK
jgi:hypothetical protein